MHYSLCGSRCGATYPVHRYISLQIPQTQSSPDIIGDDVLTNGHENAEEEEDSGGVNLGEGGGNFHLFIILAHVNNIYQGPHGTKTSEL